VSNRYMLRGARINFESENEPHGIQFALIFCNAAAAHLLLALSVGSVDDGGEKYLIL
jgi:hypothetical protein